MPSSEEAGTWEGIGATGVKVVWLDLASPGAGVGPAGLMPGVLFRVFLPARIVHTFSTCYFVVVSVIASRSLLL